MATPTENEKLELALQKFEDIMQYRGDMYSRLAKRVRTVIRGGMIVLSLVSLALSFLLYTLATQMQHATHITQSLQGNITTVSTDMSSIRRVMKSLEERMTVMESIQKNMDGITHSTADMVNDIHQMKNKMLFMQKHMHTIDTSLQSLTQSVSGIGSTMKQVGHDVDNLSQPARPFNILPTP